VQRAAVGLLILASQAHAHEGHGAPLVHLHWWEYALLGAAIAAALAWLARR
jgi:hypothetical protein